MRRGACYRVHLPLTCGVVLCGGLAWSCTCAEALPYPDVHCISLPPFLAFRYKVRTIAVFKGESRCLSDD